MDKKQDKKVKSSGGGWLLAVLLVGSGLAVACCCINNDKDKDGDVGPLPVPGFDVRDKVVLQRMRYIWGYEESFAYRNRRLPQSIEEMGDGSQIGKSGLVLLRSVWEARFETTGRIADSVSGNNYWYRIIPYESGVFKSMIVAIPAGGAGYGFVVDCGPAELKNPLTFQGAFPVYKFRLNGTKELLDNISMASPKPEAIMPIIQGMTNQVYVYRHFFDFDKPAVAHE